MNRNIQNITEALGRNSNYWGFTGSVALWYHSIHANLEPRAPHDIDIVTEKSSKTFVSAALISLGWVPQSEGSTRITFKKGSTHLDLIFAGTRLAPSLASIMRYRVSPPIVNIQSLFNRKKVISPNAKRNRNLVRLRNLGALTPVKRSSPIKSTERRRLAFN